MKLADKKHTLFLIGSVNIIILAGLLLAGCATTSTNVPHKELQTSTAKPDTNVTAPETKSQDTSLPPSAIATDTAVISGDTTLKGSITLKWRTESEQENYGFNIYRSLSKDGPWEKINPEVVPGHGTTSEPHEYKYPDTNIFKFTQYYYQLEEIDLSGNAKRLPYTIKGMDKKVPTPKTGK
jgi:hypothetical protein